MGTVQVMTVYRCRSRDEDVAVESEAEGENPIVNQLPVIETESNESFATAIPCTPLLVNELVKTFI